MCIYSLTVLLKEKVREAICIYVYGKICIIHMLVVYCVVESKFALSILENVIIQYKYICLVSSTSMTIIFFVSLLALC